MIEELSTLAPNPNRVARTLSRCHKQLEMRRADARAAARFTLERNALLSFGGIYLSSVAFNVLRVLIR